jgi:hypothetical protein
MLSRFALKILQMLLVPVVGLADQPFVKLSLAHARFVPGDKQNPLAPRIEREGDPPTPPSALKRSSFIFA